MEFKEAVQLALQSLWQNKLRSVLTLLGVVIGVASVIAVVTLVNGANTFVTTKFSSYGSDTFTVSKMPSLITNSDDYVRYQKRKNILFADYLYIKGNCKLCTGMGAQQATTGKLVRGTQAITDAQIRGYTWEMPSLQNLDIALGRGLTETDEDHASHVALIGTDVQENLFAGADPLGQELRVDGSPYTVVGVVEKQGSTFGQSQDNFVGVPLTAYQKSYGTQKTLTIYIKAGSAGPRLENAADEVRVLMRAQRHDGPGVPNSFELDTNNTLVGIASKLTASFGLVAGAIALISLIVGGIVIMNIMLVSVTERTREIGIRKALGAKRNDILLQFLIESATMALVGGFLGVFGGIVVAEIITVIAGFPSTVAVWSVFAGLVMATATGIFFGVYPARKAAALDPIVALRAD
ncbi:putative ABC transport system permease protein [Granulicella rosea]|uniref:Putative ABC transport system permease protein n=1 Tax=Granulicella rosea TaxID=474952 RepID=A0A239DLF6_9BACT|nr:ABC transporter permease [Granulicella rosea]SNS32891.1 putative ABC transport system permease protein [Granulicella rosea]